MSFFNTLDVSASGLSAQRLRMDIISQNIANQNTTKTEDGGPYRRKVALFEEQSNSAFLRHLDDASRLNAKSAYVKKNGSSSRSNINGVRVSQIVTDNTPGNKVYEPEHPDADEDGYVTQSNVNIVTEMVNMIDASRAYEANITSIGVTKAMMAKTLEIGR